MSTSENRSGIAVTSDFICPWCWIGYQHLKTAVQQFEQACGQPAPAIRFLPFELNPDMPVQGMQRRDYRSAKFGSWARSQAMDAEVASAGLQAGVQFNYGQVEVTPNTRLAHRLMVFAQLAGNASMAGKLYEAIFAAYFSRGQDIGRVKVLAEVAAAVGYDGAQVAAWLAGDGGRAEVMREELQAHASQVHSVPTVGIGGVVLTGARGVSAFARALEGVTSATPAMPTVA